MKPQIAGWREMCVKQERDPILQRYETLSWATLNTGSTSTKHL